MHIGLIGGIGPAATEFYYRGLVARHRAFEMPLELTIVHADLRDLQANAARGDKARQADIFLKLVERLAAAGADAAAITSIGGHFCVNELAALSPLPLLNAIPAIARAIEAKGLKTVGLLGTRTVMGSRLYGGIASAKVIAPEGAALDAAHAAYVGMAGAAIASEDQRRTVFDLGRQLVEEQGADVVLLAGTDLFLAFDGNDCGFPVLDCAEIHMDAIHAVAIGKLTLPAV
jgi:aspartate racemase